MILGVGTDIVNVERIRRAGDRWGDRFLRRVFTDGEIAYCRARKDPYPHLAARFAAKEAVIKALSALWESRGGIDDNPGATAVHRECPRGVSDTGEGQADGGPRVLQSRPIGFRDIEILNHPTGRPFVRLSFDIPMVDKGFCIHLSMSHENEVATAAAVLEKTAWQPL